MRIFLFQHKWLVALLVVLGMWLLLFPRWADWVTQSPMDEAITLSPRGAVNKEVRVNIPEPYELNLVFNRGNLSYEELKLLLGDWVYKDGKPIPSGVRVPIRWDLREVSSGALAASGEIDSFGAGAWSKDWAWRPIGRIKVAPGRYIFRAEILRDVPELAPMPTRLSMALTPKSASTWQMYVVGWGVLGHILVAWPAAILTALVLLWRAYRFF